MRNPSLYGFSTSTIIPHSILFMKPNFLEKFFILIVLFFLILNHFHLTIVLHQFVLSQSLQSQFYLWYRIKVTFFNKLFTSWFSGYFYNFIFNTLPFFSEMEILHIVFFAILPLFTLCLVKLETLGIK